MPYNVHKLSPSLPRDVLLVLPKHVLGLLVKVERLDPIIELSTKSEGESFDLRVQKTPPSIQTMSNTKVRGDSKCSIPSNNPS